MMFNNLAFKMSGLFMVAHQPVTEVPFRNDASTIVQVEGVLGRIGQSEDILPKHRMRWIRSAKKNDMGMMIDGEISQYRGKPLPSHRLATQNSICSQLVHRLWLE
jgi:hypothetical protein